MTYMQPGREYSFNDILDLIAQHHQFKSKYGINVSSKKTYIIQALKKAIENDEIIKLHQPGARTLYSEHHYKLI